MTPAAAEPDRALSWRQRCDVFQTLLYAFEDYFGSEEESEANVKAAMTKSYGRETANIGHKTGGGYRGVACGRIETVKITTKVVGLATAEVVSDACPDTEGEQNYRSSLRMQQRRRLSACPPNYLT